MANTPKHEEAMALMRRAQETTDETAANALIAAAQAAAQQAGHKNEEVFRAVTLHAKQIQERNVALREPKAGPATGTIDSGGGSPAPAPAPAPAPTTVSYTPPPPPPPPPPPVKIPNRDVLNFSREEFSTSAITNLFFEQISSTEIVNIARRDTIEGQNPYYSLISNLASIKREFDPTRLITKQKAVNANFAIYGIDLNNKIPDQEYLDRNNITSFFYIASNGDLVIELDNLEDDEIIDFEIANSGTINLVDEA